MKSRPKKAFVLVVDSLGNKWGNRFTIKSVFTSKAEAIREQERIVKSGHDCWVHESAIYSESNQSNELEIRTRQRDFWQKQRNVLRIALIEALEATLDDDGMWIDRNGDRVDSLNYIPNEEKAASKWEREADSLRIGNGHLQDKIRDLEKEIQRLKSSPLNQ